MAELAFLDEFRLFDGDCVRYHAHEGNGKLVCGVAVEALKRCDRHLPDHGLIPAEEFLNAYERLMVKIHDAARVKYARGEFEPEGDIKLLVKRHDLLPE